MTKNTVPNSEAPILEIWRVWRMLSLLLLPAPLRPRVLVSERVLSMRQLDQFKNYLYSIGSYAKLANILIKIIQKIQI